MWRFFFITMTGVFFCLPAAVTTSENKHNAMKY